MAKYGLQLKKKKKPVKTIHTKGGWFNILFCFGAFVFVLLIQFDLILTYTSKMNNTTSSYLVLGVLVLYTLFFLALLATGFMFNIISKSIGKFPKNSLLSKIDKALDSLLWWLILFLGVGGYLLNVIIVEYYL